MLHSVDLLIGADGSHSTVRGAVGVAFQPQDTLVLPRTAQDGIMPEAQQQHSLRLDALEQTVSAVIEDLHGIEPLVEGSSVSYPGEGMVKTRAENLALGVPVDKEQWGGAQAASQHDGWSELSIHPATE